MRMYRQGDVLILEARFDPRQDTGKPAADKILLYGEATGHSHRIEGDAAILDTPRGKTLEVVGAPVNLVHDEHDTIEIPEGFYRVIRQREYDEGEIRYVTD